MLKVEREIPLQITQNNNPFLTGLFAPVSREITADDLPVIGEIPRDLEGVYLRNGPNPTLQPRGRYHWFDGDGMVHAVAFRDGKATYRNRWIRTAGFAAEQEAGHAIWLGLMDRPDPAVPKGGGSDGWLKDTANTDLVFHNGYALALWYQCGLPYKLDARTLETLGVENFAGALKRTVSAHAKVDEHTGELLFFDYATQPPFMTYNVVSADGELIHHAPVDLPGPRLPHDMAITERHAILMDLPLFWDPQLLPKNIHKVTYYPELPSRFAVLPRYGGNNSVKWFEATPCFIYHVVNSWEDGDEIIMDACRVVEPRPRSAAGEGELARMQAFLRLEARLWRWRFHLKTGAVKEEQLDEAKTEWPTMNRRRLGRKSRYAYHAYVPRLNGLVKYDVEKGTAEEHLFGPGRIGSEAPFAPRLGARDEDDGYVVTFVADANTNTSEVLILDAKNFSSPPVARVRLPQRVPVGFHALWVPGAKLWAE
jgi:carotenoid cleavage dioxygenase-like enzyme